MSPSENVPFETEQQSVRPNLDLHNCHPGIQLFFFFFNFIYLFYFLLVLGFRFCVRAFSSCGERGPLFIAACGPLTVAASLLAEHRLQTRRLSNCGSRAQLLRGMWDLPGPGLEPVSPALAGRLSTTAPPGQPRDSAFTLEPCCTNMLAQCSAGSWHYTGVHPVLKRIRGGVQKNPVP